MTPDSLLYNNLPLNGKVQLKNEPQIYIYRGFEGDNVRRCACTLEGSPQIIWLDRSYLRPAQEQ
jgi:hypothetical protein